MTSLLRTLLLAALCLLPLAACKDIASDAHPAYDLYTDPGGGGGGGGM